MCDGVETPIAFGSVMLNPAQRNYSQLHREALGLNFGVTEFHKYLVGNQFTDRALVASFFLKEIENIASRLQH